MAILIQVGAQWKQFARLQTPFQMNENTLLSANIYVVGIGQPLLYVVGHLQFAQLRRFEADGHRGQRICHD